MDSAQHWLFWDGECGFCRASVEWIMKRRGAEQFRPMPYQQAPSPPMTPKLAARCERATYVLTTDGALYGGARAFLFFYEKTGWGALAKVLRLPPFVWAFDLGYWLVANNRSRISKWFRIGACSLEDQPPKE